MKDYNEEYFYVKKSGGEIYPSLSYAADGGDYTEVDKAKPLDTTQKRIVCYASPVPPKPELADHHRLTQHAPVISERLKDVLESLNLKEVQFLPAIILDNRHNEHEGFYIVHVYNEIKCLDRENSEWEEGFFDEERADVEKLVLDNEVLDQIPLEERLVFALWEQSTHVLYHQSVVEKILEIAPTGLTIYRLSKYDSSLPFIESYMTKRNGE